MSMTTSKISIQKTFQKFVEYNYQDVKLGAEVGKETWADGTCPRTRVHGKGESW